MQYTTTGLFVLIIANKEDDAFLQNNLRTGPFKVASFENFSSVIESTLFPDIILAKIDESSDDQLERLLQFTRHHNIPIVAIADHKNRQKASRAMAMGFSDYLFSEEITPEKLEQSIEFNVERFTIALPHHSDKNYEKLFQLNPLPEMIFEVATMKILEVNEAAQEIYGYTRDEFLKLSLLDIRPQDKIEKFLTQIKVDVSQPLSISKSIHLTKDGRELKVEVKGCSLSYYGKDARLVIITDLTEKENFKKALQHSEERFKSLVQAEGDMITVLDKNGKIQYCSPNHYTITGWKDTDLERIQLLNLVHPDDLHIAQNYFDTMHLHASISSAPYRLRTASDKHIWIQTIVTNALENPAVNGFILNSRDVTSKVKAEKQIQEISERFTALSNATSDAIYEYDYESELITFAGSGYNKFIGQKFRKNSISFDTFLDMLHPEDRTKIISKLHSFENNFKRNRFELEYRFKKKDGTYAHILDRFELIRDGNKPIKQVGAMQDISERKLQEQLLKFEKEIYQANVNPRIGFDGALKRLISGLESFIPNSSCALNAIDDKQHFYFLQGNSVLRDFFQPVNGKSVIDTKDIYVSQLMAGKKFVIHEIAQDPKWENYSAIAQSTGIQTLWCFPVKKSSGRIIAGITLTFMGKFTPGAPETNLLERAASLLGVLLDGRHAQIETERAKERYDIVAKATSDTIWDWNIQEDIFEWNKGIKGVFGYKQSEIGTTSSWWFDRIHPEDSIRMSVKLYSFIEQKTEKWQDEYRFACADGTYKYVLDRAFLVKDANGKAIRMIGAMQDITRQKEEEQRLKLLETVITQMKDAVIITEAGKSSDTIPKIVFVNPAFTEMTGYLPTDVIGKPPTVFLHRKSILPHVRKLMQSLKVKQEFKFETLNLKKNKEEYWINFSMLPITNKEGEHSHWISIQRDITEEKRQEREKEQLIRELTQNNKDLKQFSYITSHNLRAPLSNLTGLMNLLEDIPIENEELQAIISGFQKSTHLLNETINDLVKVVIIKDNPSIDKEEVQIKDVFENVFSQLNFMISMYKPIIKLQLERVSILNINKAYLESILLNLLTNAIKYRAADRKLRIFISSKMIGDSIQLIFKDNGIGIDMERNRDKIFGLYQRFHNYPDSKGLGLYLVKSQVESMGGQIAVESVVDKGTTFTITFKKQT